jgi:dipeptidase E
MAKNYAFLSEFEVNFFKNFMNNLGIILLTSTGLSSQNVFNKFKEIADFKKYKKVVIITTAALEKENNQYSQLSLSQLKSIGFEVIDFYDFENDGFRDLSAYDVVFVMGGNTFKLLKFAKEVGFDKEIKALLERGGIYVGVSAGSLIVGPSIKIAEGVDANEVGLTDFKGFSFVDFIVFPHYSNEFEESIKLFERDNNINIERINNSQAVLVDNSRKTLIN